MTFTYFEKEIRALLREHGYTLARQEYPYRTHHNGAALYCIKRGRGGLCGVIRVNLKVDAIKSLYISGHLLHHIAAYE